MIPVYARCVQTIQPVLEDVLYEGERVRLRPVRPDDAAPAFPMIHGERRVLDWICWEGPEDEATLREAYSTWRTKLAPATGEGPAIAGVEAGVNYHLAVVSEGDFFGAYREGHPVAAVVFHDRLHLERQVAVDPAIGVFAFHAGDFGLEEVRIADEVGDETVYRALVDPVRVADCRADGLPVFYGDASRAEVMSAVGGGRARVVAVTLDKPGPAERAVVYRDHDIPVQHRPPRCGAPLTGPSDQARTTIRLTTLSTPKTYQASASAISRSDSVGTSPARVTTASSVSTRT